MYNRAGCVDDANARSNASEPSPERVSETRDVDTTTARANSNERLTNERFQRTGTKLRLNHGVPVAPCLVFRAFRAAVRTARVKGRSGTCAAAVACLRRPRCGAAGTDAST